jgi:hypothetical protein
MVSRYDYHKKSIGSDYYGSKPKRKKNRLWRIFVLLLIFGFVGALFVYVFPEVDVTVVPETETVENDFEVVVDINLDRADAANNKFPGDIIEVDSEQSREFTTTGEKNVGEKAEGEVNFFNQTGLVQPLTTGNGLVTDDGVVFFVVSNIEIPGAVVSAEGNIVYGNISVGVQAKEAGEEGNVAPGRLTIIDLPFSKQNKIYAEIKSKLTGGTSEVIRVVSEDDLKNAEKEIVGELNPVLKSKIEERLSSGQKVEDDLIEYSVDAVEKAVELEEEIENFEMTVKARAKALVWDEAGVREMIIQKIENEASGDKKLIETSKDVFEVEVVEFDLSAGTAKLKIHTVNQISLPINIEAIKDDIRGMTEYEARRLLLGRENIKNVWFKFKYSITSKIPDNANRINILLNI